MKRLLLLLMVLILVCSVSAQDTGYDAEKRTFRVGNNYQEKAPTTANPTYERITGGPGNWRIERHVGGKTTNEFNPSTATTPPAAGQPITGTLTATSTSSGSTPATPSAGGGAPRPTSADDTKTEPIFGPAPAGKTTRPVLGYVTRDPQTDGSIKVTPGTYDDAGNPVPGTTYTVPRGQTVDWKNYNPAAPTPGNVGKNANHIPLSGGNYLRMNDDTGTNYGVYDTNGRNLENRLGGTTRKFNWETDTPPSDFDPANPSTHGSYLNLEGETWSIEGVDGRLNVPYNSQKNSVLPDALNNNAFVRASLEAGITDIDPSKVDRTNNKYVQGDTTIQSFGNRIIAHGGDEWQSYGQDGSSTKLTGDGVDAAVTSGGTINNDAFGDGAHSKVTRSAPDAAGKQTVDITVNDVKDGTVTQRATSSCAATGRCSYTVNGADGGTYTGTANRITKKEDLDVSGSWTNIEDQAGGPAFTVTQDSLHETIRRQFGPNAQVYQVKGGDGNLLHINGQFHHVDETGRVDECFTLGVGKTCGGLSREELDAFEHNVVDPHALEAGTPSSNALTFGQILADFRYYANAYTGFAGFSSIMFGEEFLQEWRDQVNFVMCDMLHIGGIDCWTSQICDLYVDVEEPQGSLVGRAPDGTARAIAHIEAEKSPAISFTGASRKDLVDLFGERNLIVNGLSFNLSDENVDLSNLPQISARIYKITMSYSATQETAVNVLLQGERDVNVFTPSITVQEGGVYSRIRSNPISFISATDYSTACVVFNPGVETISGKSVNRQCTRFAEYAGAGTLPGTVNSVSTGP
jgi:hypothetical protein